MMVPLGAPPKETFFRFGPYVPIIRNGEDIIVDPTGMVTDEPGSYPKYNPQNDRFTCEILPDDTIIEAPSLVTPLLLKKKTFWPPLESSENQDSNGQNGSESEKSKSSADDTASDDVEVIKVVKKAKTCRENFRTPDDYIKSAALSSLTNAQNARGGSASSLLAIEDYYKSSGGELLLSIGLSQVMEFLLEKNARKLAREFRKDHDDFEPLTKRMDHLREQIAQTKLSNKIFKSDSTHSCPRCPFTSEFSNVIEAHLDEPHMNTRKEYLCNYCGYKIRDCNQIVFHYAAFHNRRCRFEKPFELHNCRFCPFECRSKKQLTSHAAVCEQMFPYNSFLAPEDNIESRYAGVTAKPITREDIEAYERAIKTLRLAAYNPHQLKLSKTFNSSSERQHKPVLLLHRQNKPGTSNEAFIDSHGDSINLTNAMGTISSGAKNPLTSHSGWLINTPSNMVNTTTQGPPFDQTRVGSLQHPREQSSFRNGLSVIKTVSDIMMRPDGEQSRSVPFRDQGCVDGDRIKIRLFDRTNPSRDSAHEPSSSSASSSNSKPKGNTFVICEICDNYIKDLNQLKSHMQWSHKVRIHPRMLESKPPLNCQKCQWRFFTDQGLERHLLGVHGLVTSNMQESVDSGNDSGRCTVCGRAYASRLVAHMREYHKMLLKPAHLSYKCTVCSANFNLYRLFENHVYSVHSDSVKRSTGSS